MKHHIQAIFVDVGNVLAGYDHMKGCRALERRSPLTAEEIYRILYENDFHLERETGKFTAATQRNLIADMIGLDADEPLVLTELIHRYGDIFQENTEFRHVLDLITPNVPIYLCSNTEVFHSWHIDAFTLTRTYFPDRSYRLYSFELGYRKPDPAFFAAAVAHVGQSIKNCLLIDDVYTQAFIELGGHGISYHYARNTTRWLIDRLREYRLIR